MKVVLWIMMGLSWLQADLVRDPETGIVSDNDTYLEWQDDTIGTSMTWKTAIESCENLTLGGYNDWRLPNINELKSIVDRSTYNPAVKDVFYSIIGLNYWSSSTHRYLTDEAWIVEFDIGLVSYRNKNDNAYVTCVRDGNDLMIQ